MPILQRHLDGHSLASRISPGACPIRFRRGGFGRTRFHAHYDPWQRAASTQAIELDRQVHFDLLHHSAHFTGSLAWLGIADSPAFLGEPEPWLR